MIDPEIWNFFLTIALYLYCLWCIFVMKKGFEAKNRDGGLSSLMVGIFFFVFATINHTIGLFKYPFNGFLLFWIAFCVLVLYSYVFFISLKKKRTNQVRIFFSDDELDRKKYLSNISASQELKRKLFHLAVFLMVLSYYGWGGVPATTWTNNFVIDFIDGLGSIYSELWGEHALYPYIKDDPAVLADFTFFALIGFLVDLIIPDFIRIAHGLEYSVYNVMTHSVIRDKEYKSLGPHTFLLASVTFIFLLFQLGIGEIEYIFAAAFCACLGDGIGAVIGKQFGKHKITTPTNNVKTIEGFIASFIINMIIGIVFLNPLLAFIISISFLCNDYLSLPVSDNILNPIIIYIILLL